MYPHVYARAVLYRKSVPVSIILFTSLLGLVLYSSCFFTMLTQFFPLGYPQFPLFSTFLTRACLVQCRLHLFWGSITVFWNSEWYHRLPSDGYWGSQYILFVLSNCATSRRTKTRRTLSASHRYVLPIAAVVVNDTGPRRDHGVIIFYPRQEEERGAVTPTLKQDVGRLRLQY